MDKEIRIYNRLKIDGVNEEYIQRWTEKMINKWNKLNNKPLYPNFEAHLEEKEGVLYLVSSHTI